MEYQELSKMTVAIAGGIPLALEVLGSHFHSRTKEYWESELRKLKKCSPTDIQNKLRISYDGLDYINKEIFLDIAFFFVGEQAGLVTRGLEACGFEAVCGIQDLIEKALIKSDESGHIVMHDLIREMAQQIVRENPETRSRLNDANELCGILESNKGIDKIEGIILNGGERKCLQLGADIFKKMKNLRLIKLLVHVDLLGLDSLPNTLRYLHWYGYPLEYLPSGSFIKNLVELRMVDSKVKKLWDGKQDLANLKEIYLCCSLQLMELPDFSMARRLEIVYLNGCKNLRSVHPSILSLHTIVEMNVSCCKKLESLESETQLESLSKLRMNGCDGLKTFCLSSNKLRDINLLGSRLEILHFPNGKCTELRAVGVIGDRLRSLPIGGLCCATNLEKFVVTEFKQVIDTKEWCTLFGAWHNLTCLCLNGWRYLRDIPDNIKGLTRLEMLSLNDSSVETLPALNDLPCLKRIDLRSCKILKSILGLPPFLEVLDAEECTSLETICPSPLLHNECDFNLYGCVKLDESSLGFTEKLTNSSLTYGKVCYPGSRVPEWMKYKQMTEASKAIEFTCNPEQSHGIVLCCVVPGHLISCGLRSIYYRVSYDDNNKSLLKYLPLRPLHHKSNTDHVFLWLVERGLFSNGSSNDTKISCEFSLEYWNEYYSMLEYSILEACGVHLIYHTELEPSQTRKRIANICVKDQLHPIKRLKNSGFSQPTPLCLATTKSRKSYDNFICHPLQIKFLRKVKQKEVSLLHFL